MGKKIQGAFGWYLERDAILDGMPIKEYYREGFLGNWTRHFQQRDKIENFDEALKIYNKYDEPTERASSARICANG